ncbi:hypothetical protein ACIPJO_34265 [Streptomyces sp. NPDC086993]|uniref:hypothetical protein n=1 Tax=Streptomyces sp. NPDC086993 TaxID=3365765 RepID=UPI0037F3364E
MEVRMWNGLVGVAKETYTASLGGCSGAELIEGLAAVGRVGTTAKQKALTSTVRAFKA